MKRSPLALACLLLTPLLSHAGEPEHCTYVEVGKLPIRYAGPSLMPAVDGVIEGKPATMLVDTGFFVTNLTMTGAVRRDLRLSRNGPYVTGVGGRSRMYSTTLNEIAIGPIRNQGKAEVLVLGETEATPSFDAILGAPFLLQSDLEFDLRAKTMRFFRPLNCDDAPLTIWQEDPIVVPFKYRHSRIQGPNPHFKVVVDGVQFDAVIDTGAHNSFLTAAAAQRMGIDLKGPDVKRTGYAVGVGTERAPTWSTPVKTVQIGDEVIKGGELGIVATQGESGAELFLGHDFLRAHRVLFAMGQRKLYIAYLGGQVFAPVRTIEPWMQEEAENGNADAQFALAAFYGTGQGVPRDKAQSDAWLEKAAALGQPNANLNLGRRLLQAQQAGQALPRLRAALDQLPAERYGALWLHSARVKNGQAELANTELAALLKKQDRDDWPEPIARFYLGKIDAAKLLELAGDDKKTARGRTCIANAYMAEWHDARGEKDKAEALLAAARAQCPPPAPAKPAAPATTPESAPAPDTTTAP